MPNQSYSICHKQLVQNISLRNSQKCQGRCNWSPPQGSGKMDLHSDSSTYQKDTSAKAPPNKNQAKLLKEGR